MPCRLTSSKKTPSPCTRRLSSLRGTLVPAKPGFVSVGSTISGCVAVSLMDGGRLHGLHDVHVAGAAADVALDRLADLVLARLRVRAQQRGGAHQHPRRAVAALERGMVG